MREKSRWQRNPENGERAGSAAGRQRMNVRQNENVSICVNLEIQAEGSSRQR